MFNTGLLYMRGSLISSDPIVYSVMEQCRSEKCVCLKADKENNSFSFVLINPRRKEGKTIAGFIAKELPKKIKDKDIKLISDKRALRLIQETNTSIYNQYLEFSNKLNLTINFIKVIDVNHLTITFTVNYGN